jgi:hypothetical protein
VGDGHGNYLYASWADRKALLKTKKSEEADSHTSILTRAKIPPKNQERWNKYEYNPLTKAFVVDHGVDGHDHEAARNWAEALDWSAVVPALRIKPIINSLLIERKGRPSKTEIARLKKWASVWDSVRDSVWDSVWDSVRDSVGDSVWDSVWDSVRDSVWDSVWDSVRDSVWDSVRDSVGDSVGDSVLDSVLDSVGASVWAYISSFFAIKYKFDFSSAITLWEAGLVASFDGKTWRLHSGKSAEIVYEWTPRRRATK